MTDEQRATALSMGVGSIDVAEMFSEFTDEHFPARLSIPLNITVDVRSRDDLFTWMAQNIGGMTLDMHCDDPDEGVFDERIYFGNGDAKAGVEDGTDTWD